MDYYAVKLLSSGGRHSVTLAGARNSLKDESSKYTVRLGGRRPIENLTLSDSAVWSPDSRYLMAEAWPDDWRTMENRPDFEMRVVVLDLDKECLADGPAWPHQRRTPDFGFVGTPDSFEAFVPGVEEGERTALDLESLDWRPITYVPPHVIKQLPSGPIDEPRLKVLVDAFPDFLMAMTRLSKSNPIENFQPFWDKVMEHHAQNAAGQKPDNPVTFDNLGRLYAYPGRLEQIDKHDPLAARLRAVIRTLDIQGERGPVAAPQTPVGPPPNPG